jgi:hypothetical protein
VRLIRRSVLPRDRHDDDKGVERIEIAIDVVFPVAQDSRTVSFGLTSATKGMITEAAVKVPMIKAFMGEGPCRFTCSSINPSLVWRVMPAGLQTA